jgi:hypothetical protein
MGAQAKMDFQAEMVWMELKASPASVFVAHLVLSELQAAQVLPVLKDPPDWMAQLALVVILAPKVSMAIQAVQVHKALRVFGAPQGHLSLVLVDRQVAPASMDATANRVKTAEMASPACPVIEAYPAEVAVTATLVVTVGLVITVPVVLQAHQVSQEQEVYLVATVREDPKVQLEQTAETAETAGPVPMVLQAPEAPLASQVLVAHRECLASRVTRVSKEPKVKKERPVHPAL